MTAQAQGTPKKPQQVIRREDTKESREYWASLERLSKEVEKWPTWKKGR